MVFSVGAVPQQLVVRILVSFDFVDDHAYPDLWLVLIVFQWGESRVDRVCMVVEHAEAFAWCSENSAMVCLTQLGKPSG